MTSHRRLGAASLVVLTLALLSCNQGNRYYVAPGGDDSSPGTSQAPWRTIGKAARTLVAGDTVFVREGTYRERVVPQSSGVDGRYIEYTSYPGETATIDGGGYDIGAFERPAPSP